MIITQFDGVYGLVATFNKLRDGRISRAHSSGRGEDEALICVASDEHINQRHYNCIALTPRSRGQIGIAREERRGRQERDKPLGNGFNTP